MRLFWYVGFIPPGRYRILIPRSHHLPPPSLLRSHNCSLIRIIGVECATRNSAHQLFTTIIILSYPPTDLRVLPGVMMDLEMSLGPSSPMNRKCFVGPQTPGTAERRAKATFPDPHVILPGRDRPQRSRHHYHPPSIAAHYTTISVVNLPLLNRLSTAEWYPRSHPSDTSFPSKARTTALGDLLKDFMRLLTSRGSRRQFHPLSHSPERASR